MIFKKDPEENCDFQDLKCDFRLVETAYESEFHFEIHFHFKIHFYFEIHFHFDFWHASIGYGGKLWTFKPNKEINCDFRHVDSEYRGEM